MIIGLDYDKTAAADPHTFAEMCKLFRANKHKVYIVTMRSPLKALGVHPEVQANVDGVYATDGKAKGPFMERAKIKIDMWMDDNPKAIYMDADEAFGHIPSSTFLNR